MNREPARQRRQSQIEDLQDKNEVLAKQADAYEVDAAGAEADGNSTFAASLRLRANDRRQAIRNNLNVIDRLRNKLADGA